MKKILVIALTMVLGMNILTGCSLTTEANNDDGASNVDNTKEVVVADKEETEKKETKASETKEVESDQETQEGRVYPYTYIDAAGREVVLESAPERIVVTYLPLWETLMMLDVKPIGASNSEHYIATWPPLAEFDTSDIVDIGRGEVNLELLVELTPDLILDQAYDISNVDVANLEKVSPVAVFGQDTKMDWRLSLRRVGELVDKAEKAEEVILEVEELMKDARQRFEKADMEETAMVVTMMGADRFVYAYREDFYDDETGLGLNLPESAEISETYIELTMEALVELNPDNLFLNVFSGDEAILEEVRNNVVFQSLNAVKNDKLFIGSGAGHAASPMSTVYTMNFIVESLLN